MIWHFRHIFCDKASVWFSSSQQTKKKVSFYPANSESATFFRHVFHPNRVNIHLHILQGLKPTIIKLFRLIAPITYFLPQTDNRHVLFVALPHPEVNTDTQFNGFRKSNYGTKKWVWQTVQPKQEEELVLSVSLLSRFKSVVLFKSCFIQKLHPRLPLFLCQFVLFCVSGFFLPGSSRYSWFVFSFFRLVLCLAFVFFFVLGILFVAFYEFGFSAFVIKLDFCLVTCLCVMPLGPSCLTLTVLLHFMNLDLQLLLSKLTLSKFQLSKFGYLLSCFWVPLVTVVLFWLWIWSKLFRLNSNYAKHFLIQPFSLKIKIEMFLYWSPLVEIRR